ncbi:MAG: site-specific DNA-methyltransferase [Methanosarcinaceae archaeon]|nr:site-specific DNA-methyltransferase [Methanosarcinaceae archaeon]
MIIRTTGVACKNLNRNFIGFEIDENYFNVAKDRIYFTTL